MWIAQALTGQRHFGSAAPAWRLSIRASRCWHTHQVHRDATARWRWMSRRQGFSYGLA